MGQLLLRGMLAGLLASLLACGFAKVFGEPQVERALGGIFNEVPSTFPVDLLWHFGVAAFGTPASLWVTIALAFGAFTGRTGPKLAW